MNVGLEPKMSVWDSSLAILLEKLTTNANELVAAYLVCLFYEGGELFPGELSPSESEV